MKACMSEGEDVTAFVSSSSPVCGRNLGREWLALPEVERVCLPFIRAVVLLILMYNMGCLWKRCYHWSCGYNRLSYTSKFFNTSGKWQICASIHCTRLQWSPDSGGHMRVTWSNYMYTCLQIWWRSGNAGYGRVFVVIQDQDHNQFILSDEFVSSHTNIGVLRS